MNSAIDHQIDQSAVDSLIAKASGAGAPPASVDTVGGGTYNTVLRVGLADGRTVILKIAPLPDTPCPDYERDIMRSEALFLDRAAALADVPTPRVLATAFDGAVLPQDALVLTALPGRPLAEREGTELARPIVEIRAAVEANLDLLADVRTPVLVHFDLWDSNVLVADDPPRLGGVIDGERFFWGDPYADFVSLALFGDIEDDQAFLDGYRAAGGTVEFTARLRRRLSLGALAGAAPPAMPGTGGQEG
ncbi:phosphotransferase [Frankia sp. AgB32]|nr:phosphotransferase [Frankia sp. AgB32]